MGLNQVSPEMRVKVIAYSGRLACLLQIVRVVGLEGFIEKDSKLPLCYALSPEYDIKYPPEEVGPTDPQAGVVVRFDCRPDKTVWVPTSILKNIE